MCEEGLDKMEVKERWELIFHSKENKYIVAAVSETR